ncbi:MAG: sulfur carrier protein ThiS [Acidobacteriota bacterium]
MPRGVTIVLNGEGFEAPPGSTVLSLLESMGVAAARVAVELNGRVVRRDDFPRVPIREHDKVEVVHFVGGG